jgi:hypothetical protein
MIMRRKTRNKKLKQNLALLIGSIILSIFFAELILRVAYPQSLNFVVLNDKTEAELRPGVRTELIRTEFRNQIIINDQGLRDKDYNYDNPEDTIRIAVLGDSFTFGYGVEMEESYPKIFEETVNQKIMGEIEVINFGVPGYGTDDSLLMLSEKAVRYNPDIILLAFDGQTDLSENLYSEVYTMENDALVRNPIRPVTISLKIRNFLSSKLHLYNLINLILQNYKSQGKWYHQLETLMHSLDFNGTIYTETSSKELDKAFRKTELMLLEIKKFSEEHDMDLVVFLIPSKEQVDERKLNERLEQIGVSEDKLFVEKIQQHLILFFKQNDIDFINILPEFKRENKDNSFYFEIDGHINKDGNKLAGELVSDWFIQKGYFGGD